MNCLIQSATMQTNCLSRFDHFMGLALKGLTSLESYFFCNVISYYVLRIDFFYLKKKKSQGIQEWTK